MKDRKVLLLGLDGACFDFIDPLVKDGKLPTFKKLVDEGVRANLRSTIPPTTIPAWPALFTGLNQGKLGCFGQESWEKSSNRLEPVSILSWKGKLLWDIVSETKKVGIFRIPTLPKSYPINGFMITDIYSWSGSPHGNVYPPSLFDEIQSYWITKETESPLPNTMKIKLALENFRRRIEVAEYLLKHKETSLFTMITRIPDIISHFTTNLRKIQLAYHAIDKGLKRIVDHAEKLDYDLIIVSDHGTGRMINRKFCVNCWLLQNAYLALTTKTRTTKTLFIEKLMEFFASKAGSPLLRSVRQYLQTVMGKGTHSNSSWEKPIRWKDTRAFSYGGGGSNYGGIQINRSDLFSHGTVLPREYETMLEVLCDRLGNLRDPSVGDKIIEEIYTKDQIFNGPNLDYMPDIVLRTRRDIKVTSDIALTVLSSDKDSIHTEEGVFIAYGSAFKKGLEIEEIDLTDIAATTLHILDVGIPRDMDGKVRKAIFSHESGLIEKEIIHQEAKYANEHLTISDREKDEIRSRLRALGYI